MATGPEHYQEAERLIELATSGEERRVPVSSAGLILRLAQVHATLAQAAATALAAYNFETKLPEADRNAWYRAASEGPADKARRMAAEQAERAEFEQDRTRP